MKLRNFTAFGLLVALVSCGPRSQPQQPANNASAAVLPAPSAPPAVSNSAVPEPGKPGGLADDLTPLDEPKRPIDPKGAEAAGQVVQHYGALIEQKRWDEAAKLWGSPDAAKDMTLQLSAYSEAHLQIGKPADMEGAAGSIYITVPIVLYGKDAKGTDFHRSGDVTLRRVNDVPGSTEAQRRWHINGIEWTKA
jgi:hypothetical protein